MSSGSFEDHKPPRDDAMGEYTRCNGVNDESNVSMYIKSVKNKQRISFHDIS